MGENNGSPYKRERKKLKSVQMQSSLRNESIVNIISTSSVETKTLRSGSKRRSQSPEMSPVKIHP